MKTVSVKEHLRGITSSNNCFGLSNEDLENLREYLHMKAKKYPFTERNAFVKPIDLKNLSGKRRGFVYGYFWDAEYKGRRYSINISILNSYNGSGSFNDEENLQVYFEVFSNHGDSGTKYQNTYIHKPYAYSYAWVKEAIDEVFNLLQAIWDNPNSRKQMRRM